MANNYGMLGGLPVPDPAVEQQVAQQANGQPSAVQRDDQGRLYTTIADGSKSYVPGTPPKDGALSSYTWNYKTGQWEKQTDWGSIIGMLAAAGIPAASLSGLIPAVAGGNAAAGGGLAADGTLATASPAWASPTATSAAMNGLAANAGASQGIGAGVGAGVGAGLGAGAGAAASGGAAGIAKTLAALGLGGAAAINGFRTPPAQQGLEDMLGLAKSRVTSSEPLFNALQSMAYKGLPDYSKG